MSACRGDTALRRPSGRERRDISLNKKREGGLIVGDGPVEVFFDCRARGPTAGRSREEELKEASKKESRGRTFGKKGRSRE